jgi:hypothetical protein
MGDIEYVSIFETNKYVKHRYAANSPDDAEYGQEHEPLTIKLAKEIRGDLCSFADELDQAIRDMEKNGETKNAKRRPRPPKDNSPMGKLMQGWEKAASREFEVRALKYERLQDMMKNGMGSVEWKIDITEDK